jgi:hypothetical protein
MPREIGFLRRSVESARNSETLSKRQKLADPHGGVKFGFLLDGDAVADGNACHGNKRKNGETRHGVAWEQNLGGGPDWPMATVWTRGGVQTKAPD